VAKFILV